MHKVWGHRPLKFGRAKTSKIRRDLKKKLLSLNANVFEMDEAVNGFNKNYLSDVEQKNLWTLVH